MPSTRRSPDSRTPALGVALLGLTLAFACRGKESGGSAAVACPVTPVPLAHVDIRSWELVNGVETEVALYQAHFSFEGCPDRPAGEIVLRGSGPPPERALRVGLAVDAKGVDAAGGGDFETLATGSLDASRWLDDAHWALTLPVEYPELLTRDWFVVIEQSAETRYDQVSLELQYGCPCSNYDRRTDQTLDHERLDLMFDPARTPAIATAPARPKESTPFEIQWRHFYEHRAGQDPVGESGEFLAEIVITGEQGEVDRFEVTVPSIRMGGTADYTHHYEKGLEPGPYTMEVRLNSRTELLAPECPREEGLGNNTARCEFEVESCDCPSHLGDLAITDLAAPEVVLVGTTPDITWTTSHSGICGSESGESGGPIIEQMKVSAIKGTRSQLTTFSEITTIPLGSSVSRRESLPSRLSPGSYRVMVRVDPDNRIEECEHASQTNERASVYLKVVEAEGK